MTRLILIFFILLPFGSIAQTYINKSKAEVKRELVKYSLDNGHLKTVLTETDSSVILLVRDPRTLKADFIYGFDKTGKCYSEKTITYCDSCSAKFLYAALNRKKYEWVKINENQYISKFSEKMMLELPVENEYSFIILRMNWSKMVYDMLLKK